MMYVIFLVLKLFLSYDVWYTMSTSFNLIPMYFSFRDVLNKCDYILMILMNKLFFLHLVILTDYIRPDYEYFLKHSLYTLKGTRSAL